MKRNITPRDMEDLGKALERARQLGLLTQDDVNGLHARFIADDALRTPWTVGIRSLQWHKRVNGKWIAGNPPQQLQLESDLVETLQSLKTTADAASGQPAATQSAPLRCASCRCPMQPSQKFCPECGMRAAPPAPPSPPPTQQSCQNPACRQPFAGNEQFCSNCGTRRGAAPTPPRPTPSATPTPSVRRCPRCGKIIPPHLKFCTADGTPVP